MSTLSPDYLSIDYNSLITRLKNQLRNSDTFADYNFEGSNIAILIELVAYIAELNTYFTNKVAKNVHIETADVYEAVNRAARQMGYEAKGAISSQTTVSVNVTNAEIGSIYRIYPFTQIECPENQDEDGNTIKFANTILYSVLASTSSFTINMNVRQGEVTELTGYTGEDLIDNELFLPSNYEFDNDLDDDYPSMELRVNDIAWTRIPDFWDELSAYRTIDDVYMFVHDRYGRSKVVFSSSRNVPTRDDSIEITVLKSLGADGNVAIGTITQPETEFLFNETEGEYFDNDSITVTNPTESIGGQDPENIDTIKENAKSTLHTQYRNVTAKDYESHLEERSDVIVAKAWGEQEIYPTGSYNSYNRVYLSIIPSEWGAGSITYTTTTFDPSWPVENAETIMVPSSYNSTWSDTLKLYMEPRKMISAYEEFSAPVLIYFAIDFSVRIKRGYEFTLVQSDIINKLIYWFRDENHDFNSTISFNDIVEYILDTTEASPTDEYLNIKGIRNLNIRDIEISHTIYENNDDGNYPYYIEDPTTYEGDNQLRTIKLGLNQFPMLASTIVRVTQEET
jgi:hypothetical protein